MLGRRGKGGCPGGAVTLGSRAGFTLRSFRRALLLRLFGSEKLLHLGLEGRHVAERDLGILHDKDFPGIAVLVDAKEAAAVFLGVRLDKELFALKHDREDVAGVFGMGFVFLDEADEECLGIVLLDDLDLGLHLWWAID